MENIGPLLVGIAAVLTPLLAGVRGIYKRRIEQLEKQRLLELDNVRLQMRVEQLSDDLEQCREVMRGGDRRRTEPG